MATAAKKTVAKKSSIKKLEGFSWFGHIPIYYDNDPTKAIKGWGEGVVSDKRNNVGFCNCCGAYRFWTEDKKFDFNSLTHYGIAVINEHHGEEVDDETNFVKHISTRAGKMTVSIYKAKEEK